MPPKGCPHCGNKVSEDTARCLCGFVFRAAGPEVVGASAAREVAERPADKPRKKVTPARKRERAKASSRTTTRKRRGGSNEMSTAAAKIETEDDAPAPRTTLLMECPSCPARISRRAARCPKCGEPPFSACQVCGEEIVAKIPECPECGDPEPFGA